MVEKWQRTGREIVEIYVALMGEFTKRFPVNKAEEEWG